MKKSFLTSLCALCTLFLVQAADYTIETIPAPASPTLSYAIPLTPSTSTASSVTQQVYLASELSALGATAGDITGIKFYYGGKSNTNAVPSVTRSIKIYMTEIATDSLKLDTIPGAYSPSYRFKFKSAGTYVYNGSITTEALSAGEIKTLTIPFNQSSYPWDGTKNILLTVFDVTNTAYSSTEANLRFVYMATAYPRFVHTYWTASGSSKASDYLPPATLAGLEGWSVTSGDGTNQQKQIRGHLLVPKITFSISTTIPAPTNLAASSITTSSATLSWDAAAGATGYNVRWGKTSGSLDHSQNNVAATSLAISDLDDGETYYFDVQTITAGGTSAFASEASFNTTAVTHIHDDITFSKWASTTSMPTSGDYYLANNVAFGIMNDDVTLTGDLNLCLNGKTADIYGSKIVVPDGKTLTIYDNVGGGLLTGFVASEVGASDIFAKALIVVYSGGTLVLKQGTIENTYVRDADGASYAIYSNGTVRISGGVLINSNDADIYLYSTNKITLDGALSNAEKHTVFKNDGKFTIGWSTYMSGADPRDYFESANSGKSVCLSEGEAALRTLLHLSEESQNSGITTNYNQTVDVELTRSLTSAQYNTFCLPFALSAVQMAEFFGAGYDLEELTSTSLDGEILNLEFTRVYALEAGKPYLLQPSIEVVNPSFEGVTITANMPDTIETTYADLRAIYRPTELTGGNHDLLFLGEDNTLFWPESTDNMKAFRAYFELKGAGANAVQARIGRAESQTTTIENQKSHIDNHKYMKDGQLLIERNGVIYNTQGQTIK